MLLDLSEIHNNYDKYLNKEITVQGWIKNHRKQKELGFIDFHDGTHFKSLQLVYESELKDFNEIANLYVGSAIKVTGVLIDSLNKKQKVELKVSELKVEGLSTEDYPIQPKRHTREFLRSEAYLRPRTNLFQAVFRIRSLASFAIHKYFTERGYVNVHTPIITTNDGEGAGEVFNVSTIPHEVIKDGKVDYKRDFFGKKVNLSVTGQLEGESFAMAFKKIYTFGPTFRAEKSNTKTHASEFWMVEPEVAFMDINGLMDLEEDMLKYVIKYVMDNAKEEYNMLDSFVEKGLINKLNNVINKKAVRITHKEAVNLLNESKEKFEFPAAHGRDLAKEHEHYLTKYYNSPVFVKDWPKDIKAFYMKLNDDKETVAAVDLLVPGSGELMGGSQREANYDLLVERMEEMNVPKEDLWWYLNLRKFGGCYHSGFGMGFERLIMYITGIENIRDVIPYPRTPKSCDF